MLLAVERCHHRRGLPWLAAQLERKVGIVEPEAEVVLPNLDPAPSRKDLGACEEMDKSGDLPNTNQQSICPSWPSLPTPRSGQMLAWQHDPGGDG